MDVHPDVSDRRRALDAEAVRGVRPQAGPGQQLGPGGPVRGALDRDLGGGVEQQVGRVDLGQPDDPGAREADHQPVVASVTAAGGLPALGLVPGEAGGDDVVGRGVELVGTGGDQGAVLQRRQIQAETVVKRQVGSDLAVHAQAGDAAVGEDVQPDVRVAALVGHLEEVLGVALDLASGNDLRPGGGLQLGDRGIALDRDGLDGGVGRVVAPEPGGVDHDAADHAGQAEPDQSPVVAGFAPPPGLPAVVDLALGTEGVRLEAGTAGADQALLLGEGLVVGRDDRPAERPQGEVGQCGELTHGRPFWMGGPGACVGHRRVPVGPAPAGPLAGLTTGSTTRPRSQVVRTTPVSVLP